MAANIILEIVTPEKVVVSEEAQIVMSPGSEGEFGVLNGHTPFLTSLNIGAIRYKDKDSVERVVFVNGGFAEALPSKVTVLAESAERRRDINEDRAKQALDRAKQRLDNKKEEYDFARAEAALKRALYRLKIAETKRG